MCRQAAFFMPTMSKADILDILMDMQKGKKNDDGFGFGYVKNGHFVYNKTTLSLEEVLKRKSKKDFFRDCFKHDSWAIFHLRAASVGCIHTGNSHPHEVENFLVTHNGTAKNAPLIRACLGNSVKYYGETDSEVCANLIERIGVKKFSQVTDDIGAFLVLEKNNGNLWAVKTHLTDDLVIARVNPKNPRQVFICSELDYNSQWPHEELNSGWTLFNAHGEYIKHKDKDPISKYAYQSTKRRVKFQKTYPFEKIEDYQSSNSYGNGSEHNYKNNSNGNMSSYYPNSHKPTRLDTSYQGFNHFSRDEIYGCEN